MSKYQVMGKIYEALVKPLFFLIPPETIHDIMIFFGHLVGRCWCARTLLKSIFYFKNEKLHQNIRGINFHSPVGLSEGFDKDAKLLAVLPSLGFGFTQVGTVTLLPYAGNPKPRLTRLPKSKAILVNYGLKNDGVEIITRRIKSYGKVDIPYSVSIGKTNSCDTVDIDAGIADYFGGLERCMKENVGDFYTINISCPNTFGGEPFTTPVKLDKLFIEFSKLRITKPIFVKMPINLNWHEFSDLLKVLVNHQVTGVIIGNLNKDFSDPHVKDEIAPNAKGGISGKPTTDICNGLISQTYQNYGDKLTIIGVGGIFSGADAYEKIKLGASLVQLITGLIYQGPQLVSQINSDLVNFIHKDGYNNISEAVGAHHKNKLQ